MQRPRDYSISLLSFDSVCKCAQYPCYINVRSKPKQKQGRRASPKSRMTIPVLPCAVESGTQGFVYVYIYMHMYTMHSMPVVSECKLNQVDIVLVTWRATFNKCPEIPLSASFLPSFLPPSLPSFLPSFLPFFLPSFPPSFPPSFFWNNKFLLMATIFC